MSKISHATLQATAADARQDRRGGWQGSPASLAALARHRNTWADVRHCRCGLVAVTGRVSCYRHSGARNPSPARLARRQMDRRWPASDVPGDLRQLDAYRRLRFGPLRFAPLALELCEAWHVRREDPARWVAAVRAARQVLA